MKMGPLIGLLGTAVWFGVILSQDSLTVIDKLMLPGMVILGVIHLVRYAKEAYRFL